MEYKELLQLAINAKEKEKPVKKTSGESLGNLSIVYLDDYDMIISNRIGERFVFSPTKNEYSITLRNEGTKTLTSFKPIYIPYELQCFFMNKSLPVNNKVIDNLTEYLIPDFITLADNPDVVKLLTDGMFTLKSDACRAYLESIRNKGRSSIDDKCYIDKFSFFFKNHDSEYRWLCDNTSFLTAHKWNYDALCLFIAIRNKFGNEIARYFASSYTKSSVLIKNTQNYSYNPEEHLDKLAGHVDIKRLIDYLCFELYIQGIICVASDSVFKYMENAIEFNDSGHGTMSIFSEHFSSDMDKLLYTASSDKVTGCLKSFKNGEYTGVLNGSKDFIDEHMIDGVIADILTDNYLVIYDNAGKAIAFSFFDSYFKHLFSYLCTFDGSNPTKEMREIAEEANAFLCK